MFFLEVSLDYLIDRVLGRKTCIKCKNIYHNIYKPEKNSGRCDKCGLRLFTREDDTKKIIIKRYEIFKKEIKPILLLYKERVKVIDGTKDTESIYKEIIGNIKK
ncbi:MAG: hypothetical protein GY730_02420 [bacterium]|nr:hypothetical protein [bacterium]